MEPKELLLQMVVVWKANHRYAVAIQTQYSCSSVELNLSREYELKRHCWFSGLNEWNMKRIKNTLECSNFCFAVIQCSKQVLFKSIFRRKCLFQHVVLLPKRFNQFRLYKFNGDRLYKSSNSKIKRTSSIFAFNIWRISSSNFVQDSSFDFISRLSAFNSLSVLFSRCFSCSLFSCLQLKNQIIWLLFQELINSKELRFCENIFSCVMFCGI